MLNHPKPCTEHNSWGINWILGRAYDQAQVAGRILREGHHLRVTDAYVVDGMARWGIDCIQHSAFLIPHEDIDWSLSNN